MRLHLVKQALCTALIAGLGAAVPSSASASVTTAQAMSGVAFLSGSWHCTGGGPAETDVYTIGKNVWHDTDSLGGVTMGTFDAKRQKWVVFFMNDHDGEYGVNEAGPMVSDVLHLTVPYPPSMSAQKYNFTKVSDTQYKLGKQICIKK
jgi:hypothetical protein